MHPLKIEFVNQLIKRKVHFDDLSKDKFVAVLKILDVSSVPCKMLTFLCATNKGIDTYATESTANVNRRFDSDTQRLQNIFTHGLQVFDYVWQRIKLFIESETCRCLTNKHLV